ncbi:50S ribosomal protein L35ae [Candidatus Woesearchaeota archaeon CG_4_10_14_0_2_um_filter_33_10]|nr:MAG: 50S ribosomal protein L35ae [Candidatus Woesearchaeota archaeon CG1_02_33_12]PIN77548.1 MAG: 50S ribosomal protein L35ae [Candidatus Woesearchaeota archaeon CG10_big_fil_rev_8_21_14_0_10_33_12]PIU72222.1 MAG: 50S ribosomal protein L35ae [Candidatus Woesearchaeota archaeon CG06_land_8_20_14_3_00_33_13]PIZ51901.1 MAG: 50S ribosomal protein L35ae [Candidatus Woesearchaeota archaeon CG_4_10_14_0_2_um_filter_33_10]
MEGVIMNFRGGRHTQCGNQMIIVVDGVDSKEKATALIGKKVTWSSSAKKEIKGAVRSAHGCNGALRVLFETGMPGQSIGQKVKIE